MKEAVVIKTFYCTKCGYETVHTRLAVDTVWRCFRCGVEGTNGNAIKREPPPMGQEEGSKGCRPVAPQQ